MSSLSTPRILFLGAAAFQLPPIEYARARGMTVLTTDNAPDNPGHRLAHRAYEVSTVDTRAVRRLASRERVDAILSFGSDVSAHTAAVVARDLGLPGPDPDTILTLTSKTAFRRFQNDSGLQRHAFDTFRVDNLEAALAFAVSAGDRCVIKPDDASGSRGVSIVRPGDDRRAALRRAAEHTRSGRVIVEAYVERSGSQICGDGLMLDGHLVFVEFGNGYFHPDPDLNAPYAEAFPAALPAGTARDIRKRIEDTLRQAGYLTGLFNLDVILDDGGQPFVIELGPRAGGNLLPEAIGMHWGLDFGKIAVDLALMGRTNLPAIRPSPERAYGCYVVHSLEKGRLREVIIDERVRPRLKKIVRYLRDGEEVMRFRAGRNAIGVCILGFESREEMLRTYDELPALIYPIVE